MGSMVLSVAVVGVVFICMCVFRKVLGSPGEKNLQQIGRSGKLSQFRLLYGAFWCYHMVHHSSHPCKQSWAPGDGIHIVHHVNDAPGDGQWRPGQDEIRPVQLSCEVLVLQTLTRAPEIAPLKSRWRGGDPPLKLVRAWNKQEKKEK